MATLILTAADSAGLLDHPSLIYALRRAYIALDQGDATQPVPDPMRAANDNSADGPAYIPMASYAPYLRLYAVKMLADLPLNRNHGIAAQRSTISLYSTDSAECLALIDGKMITRMRTAATTVLATETLARKESTVLGLIGAGALAAEHVLAHHTALDIEKVVVWSRSHGSRERLRTDVASLDLKVEHADEISAVFAQADIVCTLTPSTSPIVLARHIRPGIHLNAVGSPPRPVFSELDPHTLAAADLVTVDHLPLALRESGNIRHAIDAGTLNPADLVALGAVLTGSAPGRAAADQVTIFNSVGFGLQDLVAADLLYRRALTLGIGAQIDLREPAH
ncbi:ornithine cyclodeaminase family protein [Frankia sp. AgB32]|uniref:ornithine cyclodeaminase family protein n=1 Tax=Frankia sp. AgB32 TaxID=631119 RepID=UPI00200F2D94|nr:ornithine cyclodeaminase family protein [Frankia sp. AgB32]MCK9897849.1 ornithine cyclodeaminase family protein [Frankia sp. AgB32]